MKTTAALATLIALSSAAAALPEAAASPQSSSTGATYWSPPSAAIHWAGLASQRVYVVDPQGTIREWRNDGAGWQGPDSIGARARVGTGVAVNNVGRSIRVYYQGTGGGAYLHQYDDNTGWISGGQLP